MRINFAVQQSENPPSFFIYIKYGIFMAWIIKYSSDKLQSDLLDLPPGLLSRYLHCTDRMLIFGPDLGMPHTRAIGQGLYELRLKSKEGLRRVMFALFQQDIVMLHLFAKKKEKTPLKELALARQRMKEWNDADT